MSRLVANATLMKDSYGDNTEGLGKVTQLQQTAMLQKIHTEELEIKIPKISLFGIITELCQ